MKKFQWKKALPHLIAIVVFILVALIYCKPALQGEVLQQTDVVHWRGMAQDVYDHKEKTGVSPLWNTRLFSGMPNYQIAMQYVQPLQYINMILTLNLPKPANFFFLACLCFYLLCAAYRTNYLVAILGSLAFAYSTYDPVIVSVGHDTKMLAIAYMPALLAGLYLLYEKRYAIGLATTVLFASMEVFANHPQINYYSILIAGFITIAYIIKWIKNKQWKHMLIACGLALFSGIVAVANSALVLLTTSEYSKYTMRGGKSLDNSGGTLKDVKTTGLDEDYAFQYSQGNTEFLTFLMPNVFGGSSSETFDADSKIASTLIEKGVPESNAQQLAQSLPKYWGDNYSTAGPVYLGAIICILFIIGMVVVSPQQKWWMFAACLFAVLMASGKYLLGFNEFLFHHLPLYNKFRAPTIALVIPQLLFPLLAVLALQKIFFEDTKPQLQASFKYILYAVGGVFVFIGLMYLASDFRSANDNQIKSMLSQVTGNNQEFGNVIYNSMIAERKSMFSSELLRALLFALVTVGAVFLYLKSWVKPMVIVIALIVISTFELLKVDSKYLTDTNYVEPDSYEANFNLTLHGTPTDATAYQSLQADKDPHFRTFNLAPDRYSESITAYHYRCVGGYNPAKLSIYQDLIENQLTQKLNLPVLNMLDAKYFLAPEGQQPNTFTVQRNEAALGACWFVKNIKYVNGAAAEMGALTNFNPADTAIVDAGFKSIAGTINASDSTSNIKLVGYDNDDIKYASQSNVPNFAVFSEVYYPVGWKAYIDGKETPYCKVNYVLRGMPVPAGKHDIEFKFHPTSYYTGQSFNLCWKCIILLLCLIGAVVCGIARRYAFYNYTNLFFLLKHQNIKLLIIEPYRFLPAINGGQKAIEQLV